MGLAVVRSLGAPRRLVTAGEIEDFEQERLHDLFGLHPTSAARYTSALHKPPAAEL